MKVLEQQFVRKFIDVCTNGYKNGWHERNGGNLSYRIKDEEVLSIKKYLKETKWIDLGANVPGLKNEYFLVSVSGSYMRNMASDPESCLCIIKVNETGDKYMPLWGLKNGGRPTSELPSHLLNLQVVKERTNGEYRIVYHCHATNLIALTFVLPLNNKDFTRNLWEMSTECSIVFPMGVGVLHFMVPGGHEIAVETSKLMEKYDVVVWAHHGLFVTGKDFDDTYGLAETVEKAATILVKVLSMTTLEKRNRISKKELLSLEPDFNVKLNEEFLD